MKVFNDRLNSKLIYMVSEEDLKSESRTNGDLTKSSPTISVVDY